MKNLAKASSQDGMRRWFALPVSRAAKGDSGQALVELALTVPIFILLLVGAAELGRLAYAAIEVSNAARAGVQYGAQSNTNAADTAGIKAMALADGSNLTGLTVVSSYFCQCSDGTADASCLPASCTTEMLVYSQVNTAATVATLFHYPGIPGTFTLRGQAIMRTEQ